MHGYAINPARDFGPRLFTVVAGFKNNGLTDGTNVFRMPIASSILGAPVGAESTRLGIRRFLTAR
jgi:glycerol uptake facilitator protein